MPAHRKPKKPRVTRLPPPPDSQRCTAIAAKTGERCTAWAAWRQGSDLCQGHLGVPQYRPGAEPEAQEIASDDERDRIARAGAEGQLRDAVKRLEQVDPLDPDAFVEALSLKERREQELARLVREQQAKNVEALEPPLRTPDMHASGTFWTRHEVDPDHPVPGAIFDPETGRSFVWQKSYVQPRGGSAYLNQTDVDVDRLRAERAAAGDDAREAEVAKERDALLRRWDECRNPYAAQHFGRQIGLDMDDYLVYLQYQIERLDGRPVDLNGTGDEYEDVVLPELRAVARRRAWSSVKAL
jgi:hypothetical protein